MVLLLFPSFAYNILAFEDISGTIAHVYTSDLYVTMKSKTFYYYPKPWQFALQVDTYHKMDLSISLVKFIDIKDFLLSFLYCIKDRTCMYVEARSLTNIQGKSVRL